jgi:hypothetical protein
VEKCIDKEMARLNWEMNLEEPCEDIVKEDVDGNQEKSQCHDMLWDYEGAGGEPYCEFD